MYLIDTNIWLERLLDQERSAEVGSFLDRMPSNLLFITDFSFHSIGVIMSRLNRMNVYLDYIKDAFFYGSITIIRLEPDDIKRLVEVMDKFKLDFDDAYQYTAAEKWGLTLVSFDRDFDSTDMGRKMPGDIRQ
ncbi:MAG: PIN domain-containing protein [Proteobacteria bacterium]|nr:PIN domain-containing protein [Pseudomonadota bacterium]